MRKSMGTKAHRKGFLSPTGDSYLQTLSHINISSNLAARYLDDLVVFALLKKLATRISPAYISHIWADFLKAHPTGSSKYYN